MLLYYNNMITCTFEDKGTGSLRHVTVTGIAEKDNNILFIRRAPHLSEPNKWALPGGFFSRDEKVRDAVLREVLEESGYSTRDAILFLINSNPDRPREDRQNVDFSFIVTVGNKTGQPDNEVSDVRWFPIDNLPPEKEVAFDHYMLITKYIEYRKKKFSLPVLI